MPTPGQGWATLGQALAGNSEQSYQEGLALGAKTQDALAAARARVQEFEARKNFGDKAIQAGVDPNVARAMESVFQGGGNVADFGQAQLRNQEYDFRAIAGNPETDITNANAALRGVASGPVDRFQKVGGGADDRFDAAGIVPLGDAIGGGDGGGTSAAIQLINEVERRERAIRGDPNFQLSPQQTLGIARETQRVADNGGVVSLVDLAASLGLSGGRPPAPAPAGVAPVVAPVTAAPPVSAPAAPQSALTPLTTAGETGANAAEIERAKVVGKGVGEAQLHLPQARARFNNQTAQADLVINDIDTALEQNSSWTTGPMGLTADFLPGSPAANFKATIDGIKANVGFQQLQQMRYESPTGGALGQVAVQELEFLQAALGNLSRAQSPAQMAEQLQKVSGRYKQFKQAAAADYAEAEKLAAGMVGPNAGTAPVVGSPAAPAPAPAAPAISLDEYLKSKGH